MRYLHAAVVAVLLASALPRPAHANDQPCATLEGVSATTQHREFWINFAGTTQTMVAVGCSCQGTCATPTAQLRFETRAGNVIALQGGGDLSCSLGTSVTTSVLIDTADADRIIPDGQGIRVGVANTPATHDKVTICVKLSEP